MKTKRAIQRTVRTANTASPSDSEITTFLVYCRRDTVKSITELAALGGTSRSRFVRMLLEDVVQENQDQYKLNKKPRLRK